MLLLRWSYFAQTVPAEVTCLVAVDENYLPDDELDEEFVLGRQPIEDDYQPILLFEEFEDEPDEPSHPISLPEADDFLQFLLPDDGTDDEADDDAAARFQHEDDFIDIYRPDDEADDDAADEDLLLSFDFGNPAAAPDITEILSLFADDPGDDDPDQSDIDWLIADTPAAAAIGLPHNLHFHATVGRLKSF